MLDDPEIRDDFCNSSMELITEMESLLEDFEDEDTEVDASNLEKYGQLIDRIMGAADTLGATQIGQICRLGKIIGYKSSQSKDKKLQVVTAGIGLDSLDILSEMFNNLKAGKTDENRDIDAFIGRLKWLSGKFKDIDRASCDPNAAQKNAASINSTAELDALLRSLS